MPHSNRNSSRNVEVEDESEVEVEDESEVEVEELVPCFLSLKMIDPNWTEFNYRIVVFNFPRELRTLNKKHIMGANVYAGNGLWIPPLFLFFRIFIVLFH